MDKVQAELLVTKHKYYFRVGQLCRSTLFKSYSTIVQFEEERDRVRVFRRVTKSYYYFTLFTRLISGSDDGFIFLMSTSN